jgi:hypothetical protein
VSYPQSYYDEIRGKLQAVLFMVAPKLPESTRSFVTEELDANELGVALETMVDVLAEVSAPVTREVVDTLAELARTMKLDYDVAGILATSIVDEGGP